MKRVNLSRNMIYGFSGWLVPLSLSFFLTPVIVRGLGMESYGLYVLIATVVGYFATLNFNVGRSITKFVSAYHAEDQIDRIAEAISGAILLYVGIGVVSATVLAVNAHWLVARVLNVNLDLRSAAMMSVYLASAGLVFTLLSQVFSAVSQAMQRFDLYCYVMIVSGAATVIGNAVLVSLGNGVVTVIAWNVTVNLASCLAFFLIARRLLPGIRPVWRFRKLLLYELLRFSGAVTGYQLLGNLLLLFERSWLNRNLGAAAVTFYAVPMTIGIYIHSFINSFSIVLFPLASEANALGNRVRLEELYANALKYVGALVFFATVTLSVGSWQFMANWMGIEFAEKSSELLQLQVIAFGLMALMIVPWQIADGLGIPIYNVMLSLWWLVVSCILGVALTPILGMKGFVVGRLAGMIGIPIYIYCLHKRVFGKPPSFVWSKILPPLVLSGTVVALIQALLYAVFPLGWIPLGIAVALSGLVFLGILSLVGYINREERQRLQRIFKRA